MESHNDESFYIPSTDLTSIEIMTILAALDDLEYQTMKFSKEENIPVPKLLALSIENVRQKFMSLGYKKIATVWQKVKAIEEEI